MTSRAKGMNGPNTQVDSSGMIPKPPEHVATITDDDRLAAFVERMHLAPWLAVDTEFQRERSYFPELGLLQVATDDEIGLIDMLAVADPAPLTELIGPQGPLKVFHAAGQDIEVLHQALGVLPSPVFDTQIAAALAGMADQIGYARLIEELTGTRLAKSHTRTEWSRRPLSRQALAYAADDVRHLAVAYPMLRQRLQELGRLAWAEADAAEMTDPARLAPAPAWRRVRAWRQLQPAQQQVLAALAEWREQQARRANRPRQWIVPDQALLALARAQPASQAELDSVQGLARKTAQRHGPALLAAISRARQHPATPLAADPGPLTPTQKQDFKSARKALAICARDAGIPAPMLAGRRELEKLVTGERDLHMLHGWRADVAGHAIVDVIEGRRRVAVSGDSARLVENVV